MGFGFLFVICFVVLFFISRRDRKTKKSFQSIRSFTPTHMFCSSDSTTGVAIDSSQNKIAFCRNKALSLKKGTRYLTPDFIKMHDH